METPIYMETPILYNYKSIKLFSYGKPPYRPRQFGEHIWGWHGGKKLPWDRSDVLNGEIRTGKATEMMVEPTKTNKKRGVPSGNLT